MATTAQFSRHVKTKLHPTATTQTERWTVHAYPAAMWPDTERRVGVLFDENDQIVCLDLTGPEAKELAAALLRAAEIA